MRPTFWLIVYMDVRWTSRNPPWIDVQRWAVKCFLLHQMCEIGNFFTHLTLSGLRGKGEIIPISILPNLIFKYIQWSPHFAQVQGVSAILCQARTHLHGCFSLYHVQTTHMRWEKAWFWTMKCSVLTTLVILSRLELGWALQLWPSVFQVQHLCFFVLFLYSLNAFNQPKQHATVFFFPP